ncbi:hypothetical protein [Methylocapsa sp. S129]|uniref:hypothetical protein n=1 Tax=Methylocapsa sp. S129 TaxID=1641869 RepID=UPI00131DB95B|nr:hypothetical protein [Methylocapsa sp. S129]
MKRFAKFLAICAIIIVGGYAACSALYPTFYLHYRLSLDLDVDGKAQTSSGVVEIAYPILSEFRLGEGRKFAGIFHGNAITIDLGQRGLVFIVNMMSLAPANKPGARTTLRPPGSVPLIDLPFEAYGLPSDGTPSTMERVVQQVQQKTGSVDVTIDKLPMFVRFTDINDPRSIEEIDPADLAATFGPRVRLLSARLEVTRDPVTPIPPTWPKWLVDAKTLGFLMRGRVGVDLWLKAFKGE